MKPVLLIDFGSTYTKVTAVDVDGECLLGTAQAYTTIQTDLTDGLDEALEGLRESIGQVEFSETYACSSAAGGLRMVTSGLVPELTSEAAKLASLGAGAKLVGIYSYEMTEDDIEEIISLKPDIFLLVGGTDGGNKTCIIHNAKLLAALPSSIPIVIAGNRVAAKECERILDGHPTYICDNVMPKFGVLKIESVQNKIREIFLDRIIQAKGLTRIASLMDDIIMPTPAAVLRAMTLLAEGTDAELGIGELVGIDVGGATTDIYSVADGMPRQASTVYKGLPEPYAKRTVEGDIGMRYSIHGIVDAAGADRIAQLSNLSVERVNELTDMLSRNTDRLPGTDEELKRLDFALASMAAETAVARHAGTMEEAFTMMGPCLVQSGKDLRQVKQLIVTGGSLIHTEKTADIAAHALADKAQPNSLRPLRSTVRVDRRYILAAMGLLSIHYPDTALRIMKRELEDAGYRESGFEGIQLSAI